MGLAPIHSNNSNNNNRPSVFFPVKKETGIKTLKSSSSLSLSLFSRVIIIIILPTLISPPFFFVLYKNNQIPKGSLP